MIEWLFTSLLIVVFAISLNALKLSKRGGEIAKVALDSLEILSLPNLSDREKETKLQKNSLQLFALFFKLLLGLSTALAIPFGILWLGETLNITSVAAVIKLTFSPWFLIVSSIFVILYFSLYNQRLNKKKKLDSNYTGLDKLLHEMAFKTYATQVSLAKIEDNIFAKKITHIEPTKPVFITALPRAGTTLILECLAAIPEFAAHSYRDMPFLLIPCFWNSYSSIFQRQVAMQERAHGDGMQISPDSPEAFEEIIWSTFWQKHYQEDRIIPWDHKRSKSFETFFQSHMKKIIFLRRHNKLNDVRYISKNNGNIARTRLLRKLFPDAIILVPFRDPLHHASSLLKQHLNFLDIHQDDPFAQEYMKAIGHFDFGKNLRPIDFNNWFDDRQTKETTALAFWLEYWVAGYKYLLNQTESNLYFFNYDSLCEFPEIGLQLLADLVDSRDTKSLIVKAHSIRPPKPKQIDTTSVSKFLLREVDKTYALLKASAQSAQH